MKANEEETRYDPILFIRGLSRGDKAKFKAYCAERQTTMTQKVINWIQEVIRGKESVEPDEVRTLNRPGRKRATKKGEGDERSRQRPGVARG